MPTLTVTAQGQITLRRELLRHLRILPGRQVTVDKRASGVLALHTKAPHGLEGFVRGLFPRTPVTATHNPR
jgi:antitoxin PrlF